jgi:hypothetical protein
MKIGTCICKKLQTLWGVVDFNHRRIQDPVIEVNL